MENFIFAVVGCTGLVGRAVLSAMAEYGLPVGEVRLFASKRSAGGKIDFLGESITIECLKDGCFRGVDVAFFCAGREVSFKHVRTAVECGCLVVDNSSCFRMDGDVPLVVPEVNFDAITPKSKLIANPNCSTIQTAIPLNALNLSFGLQRVNFCTYQAVSGSGQKGISALKHAKTGVYPYDIANNCIPQIGAFLKNGYTEEEEKMIRETKKILGLPNLKISATCVRVPVEFCHGVSVCVELEKPFTLYNVRETLAGTKGVRLVDDFNEGAYPVNDIAVGKDDVFVGRIRRDVSCENGLIFYCVADNVRKGAGVNAVQIVKEFVRRGWL